MTEAVSVGGRLSRSDLLSIGNDYLEALGKRDYSRLKLTPSVRFTENCQAVPLGTALWATATSSGSYRVPFADVQEQQVGVYAVVEEMGFPAVLAVRLKVESGLISEVEHIVGRSGSSIFAPENLKTVDPVFESIVPVDERSPRETLIRASDLYYVALEQGDGNILPVIDECVRRENGALTALTPQPTSWGSNLSVAASIHLGCWTNIKIRNRRYPLVDEERCLCWGITMFENAGNVAVLNLRGIGPTRLPSARLQPSATLVSEVFKVVGGKIHHIETVLGARVPYGTPSGWD